MTGRSQKTTYNVENDIEKNREEGNWSRMIEIAEILMKSKPPLYNFLVGEAKLETYLDQNPPIESNAAKARIGLLESKQHLLESVTEQGDKCGVALDGHLLLAKLQYAMGDYEGALKHFIEADLQSLTEKALAQRSIRIIAESYAIKGICLEKNPPMSTSKYVRVEWIDQIQRCYELASDLGLLYMQQQDKQNSISLNPASSSSSSSSASNSVFSILIETVIRRAPVFLMEHGRLINAVNYCRNVLSAAEANGTHELRLIFCKLLAEILTYRLPITSYNPPEDTKRSVASPWKPRKFIGISVFLPRSKYEEIILLLLISEAMAAKNAVLSQSPEFKEARLRAFSNAAAIYDLMTVVLCQWRQYSILQEAFVRAMKFSSDEPHVWLQQALCFDASGQYTRALSMITEVVRMLPNNTVVYLTAARIAYHGLSKIDEGLKWSQKAIICEQKNPQNLLSRCYLYEGIGAHCKSRTLHIKSLRDKYVNLAFSSFIKAQQIDPEDHLIKFYLGLHTACQFQTAEAVSYVKKALKLYPEHLPSLHLMILLLSAQKQMKEAQELLDSTLQDYPDSVALHFLKIYLELHVEGTETALYIGKHLLSLWKTNTDSHNAYSETSDNNRVFFTLASEFSDKDSNSLHAPQALVVSRNEHALSEVASSFDSSVRRPPSTLQHAWTIQHRIWLLLAEIYLQQDQLSDASLCLQEAMNIFPLSHNIMYLKGRLHEHKNEFIEAKQYYKNALAINPCHIKSLQHLGLMYHYLNNQKLAEKTLRFAAKLDPWSSETWYNLGKVLEVIGDANSATDCLATALHTETISPVMSYTSIPMTFE